MWYGLFMHPYRNMDTKEDVTETRVSTLEKKIERAWSLAQLAFVVSTVTLLIGFVIGRCAPTKSKHCLDYAVIAESSLFKTTHDLTCDDPNHVGTLFTDDPDRVVLHCTCK